MEPLNHATGSPESAADLDRDRKLEVLLDEMVASSPAPPREFAAQVAAARPFAPWEVRRASAWRIPLLATSGLLAASLAVFLAPLGGLAPGTALAVWGQLFAAALSSPVSAALEVAPALAVAADSLRAAVTPGAGIAILGAGAAFGAATIVALRRQTVRVPR